MNTYKYSIKADSLESVFETEHYKVLGCEASRLIDIVKKEESYNNFIVVLNANGAAYLNKHYKRVVNGLTKEEAAYKEGMVIGFICELNGSRWIFSHDDTQIDVIDNDFDDLHFGLYQVNVERFVFTKRCMMYSDMIKTLNSKQLEFYNKIKQLVSTPDGVLRKEYKIDITETFNEYGNQFYPLEIAWKVDGIGYCGNAKEMLLDSSEVKG